MDQDKLTDIIVAARKRLGMNQGEASIHCGFSETYLGMIERKKRTPGPKALLRLMIGLKIDERVMREFLPPEFDEFLPPGPDEIEKVRKRALNDGSFSELPAGLQELIYDQETFHQFHVREEELEYMKSVQLMGMGGEPTKDGYLMELERFRQGGYPSREDSLQISRASHPQLFEVMGKILRADESVRERIIKAIEPVVDAIIEISVVSQK
jgi:transcriptional regulator with XRE-family HTH domain